MILLPGNAGMPWPSRVTSQHILYYCTYYSVSFTCTIHCTYYTYCTLFLYKYIFHYKYVASAVIYFKCGWRIPKSVRNGKKSDVSTSSTTSTLRLPLYILSAVDAYKKSVRNGKKSDGDAARYLCTVKSEKFKFKWSVKCYEVKWWSCYQFWYDDFQIC